MITNCIEQTKPIKSKDKLIECIFLQNKNFREKIKETFFNQEPFMKRCSQNDEYVGQIEKSTERKLSKFYNKNFLFRLSLKIKLFDKQENRKPIIVILMNPSYADENGLDDTLINVKNFIEIINNCKNKNEQYSEIIILNIYPIRMPESRCLDCLLHKYDFKKDFRDKNIEYIKSLIKKDSHVLLAWGADCHFEKYTQEICKILQNCKNIFVYYLNTSKGREGTPSHFTSRVYNRVKKRLKEKSQKLELIQIKINTNKCGDYIIERNPEN